MLGFGAFAALVGHTLWIARSHLRQSLQAAIHPERESDRGGDFSMRSLFIQLFLGFALMTGWFIAIGVPWWAGLAFVGAATATFLGITRILCESGLAATRAQLNSSSSRSIAGW